MLSEAVDTAVTACDKFPENLEAAAQMLKVSTENHLNHNIVTVHNEISMLTLELELGLNIVFSQMAVEIYSLHNISNDSVSASNGYEVWTFLACSNWRRVWI